MACHFMPDEEICRNVIYLRRPGDRAVDLGGASVYQGEPKFKIKHKSRCPQKSKLVNWEAQACRLGDQAPMALSHPMKTSYIKSFVFRLGFGSFKSRSRLDFLLQVSVSWCQSLVSVSKILAETSALCIPYKQECVSIYAVKQDYL